jgi:predicted ArsR family transcriptional regulator
MTVGAMMSRNRPGVCRFDSDRPASGSRVSKMGWSMLREQLLDSSRGRVLGLLRQGGMTVEDLASRLGVTTNAVREHLARMERDGLVERAGQRRGVTRPSHIFVLTTAVEQFLSHAYVLFLTQLVRVLSSHLTAERMDNLMRQVGRGLADELAPQRRPTGRRARVVLASSLMDQHLGTVTRVEANGSYVIRGVACPLAAVTGKHRSVCIAIESLVERVVAAPVRECCDRTGRPRCCFEIRRSGSH